MVSSHVKSRALAVKRALRFLREWRHGKSYKMLAKEYGISFGRCRELVRRGKVEEAKLKEASNAKFGKAAGS